MDSSRTHGASPAATGGQGVTFAQRVGALFFKDMLTGTRRADLGDQIPTRIAFQTSPMHAVDDILLESTMAGSTRTLAVACRLTPVFVQSHVQTIGLINSILQELEVFSSETHQVAIALTGKKSQYDEVRKLTEVARAHPNAPSFIESIETPRRYTQVLRNRYDHIREMVAKTRHVKSMNVADLKTTTNDKTWLLLSRLHLLQFNVQSPDRSDWLLAATELDPYSSNGCEGLSLLDNLSSLCSEYDSRGADVVQWMLRRDLHSSLSTKNEINAYRSKLIDDLDGAAMNAVRHSLGQPNVENGQIELGLTERRMALSNAIVRAGAEQSALLVTGKSGTGKSSSVVRVIQSLRKSDNFDAILLNLRDLPRDVLSFESSIGGSFQDALLDLSAPARVLVVDAADITVDSPSTLFSYLVSTAKKSNVGFIAVSSDNTQVEIASIIEQSFPGNTGIHEVRLLTDLELSEVSDALPMLSGVLRGLGADSIYRRLVILDLLARTGQVLDRRLSEWECLELVWKFLIRKSGTKSNASAEARHNAMLALSAAHIERSANKGTPTKYPSPPKLYPVQLDNAAVDALRHDLILAPWNARQSWPEFAHDEIRRFATTLLLYNHIDDFPMRLAQIGAPRWTLSAAALVCQGILLDSEDSSASNFIKLLNDFTDLSQSLGPRWADVPIEAVLNSPNSHSKILAALTYREQPERLVSEGQHSKVAEMGPLPLGTLLRVMRQRLNLYNWDDLNQANPAIEYILRFRKPWTISSEVFELLSNWLFGLVNVPVSAGNSIRIQLRKLLVEFWDETCGVDEITNSPSSRTRIQLPTELCDSRFIELLALLGLDTNKQVTHILKLLASNAPECLAPAVDAPTSAISLASYDVNFLANLIEAYYIDETVNTDGYSFDKGIRPHRGRWHPSTPPFSSPRYGGFSALFSAAPISLSARVLNRLLNHAATKIRDESQSLGDAPAKDPIIYELDLGLGVAKHSGQEQMWCWYRTRSGAPAPCLSALQAMELVVDILLTSETFVRARRIIEKLLHNCENLAVPGLIYGILVRHLESSSSLLFPFLAEPMVWEAEFSGIVRGLAGWGTNTEGLSNSERRNWSPREVAHWLVFHADTQTRAQLDAIGRQLVENGRAHELQEETELWASCLDTQNYKIVKNGKEVYSEFIPPSGSLDRPSDRSMKLFREYEYVRIQNAYRLEAPKYNDDYVAPTDIELADDLDLVRKLSQDNEDYSYFAQGATVDVARESIGRAATGNPKALGDNTSFAIQSILKVARSFASNDTALVNSRPEAYGVENSAANTIPLLLFDFFIEHLETNSSDIREISALGNAVMRNADFEPQLFLARGCDPIWDKSCSELCPNELSDSEIEKQTELSPKICAHKIAYNWLVNAVSSAVLMQHTANNNKAHSVQEPIDQLERIASSTPWNLDVTTLSISIRGFGSAAASQSCYKERANAYLVRLLDAQFHALKYYQKEYWGIEDSETVLLIAARSLLQIWNAEQTSTLLGLVNQLAGYPGLIADFLEGVSIAGAENLELGTAAKEVWPLLMDHVLDDSTFKRDFKDNDDGHWMASALLPQPIVWAHRPYVEVDSELKDWVEAADLVPYIEKWINVSRGNSHCLKALVHFLERLNPAEQASKGLHWIHCMCIEEDRALIPELYESNRWITSIRSEASKIGLTEEWQSLVDVLVANGNQALAPYSR